MMLYVTSESIVVATVVGLIGILVSFLLLGISKMPGEPIGLSGVVFALFLFVLFVCTAAAIIVGESNGEAMKIQANEDFQNKCVDLDLYVEDAVYKETIDKELTKEKICNSSLSVSDFCKGDC